MATKAKTETTAIKVIAEYPAIDEDRTLWGVPFKSTKKGEGFAYIAEVDSETAKSLIDNKRAKKA